jgi:hypothetical protein
VRPRQPLLEQRDGEQGDPDDECLVDEGGLCRGRLGETFEEEDEGDASADDGDGEEREPLVPGPGPRRGSAISTSRIPATPFFAVVYTVASPKRFTA